jgi:hypothetical protein
MQCKKCNQGLALQIAEREITPEVRFFIPGDALITALQVVVCDCCGGFYEHCENCETGKRVINWVDEMPQQKANA